MNSSFIQISIDSLQFYSVLVLGTVKREVNHPADKCSLTTIAVNKQYHMTY